MNDILAELINKDKKEINLISPLVWAYVGDAVYELYIRNYLVNTTKLNPHKLHIEAINYVKAGAQAKILQNLMEDLTDEEKDIVRRARNVQNHHLPKNADITEYMYSTAFEGLIGYLYLTKQEERLKEILKKCIEQKRTLITCYCLKYFKVLSLCSSAKIALQFSVECIYIIGSSENFPII